MHRRLPRALRALVVLPVAITAAGADASAPPPDDDAAAEALGRFEELARDEGYDIVGPACVSTADEVHVIVCYALTVGGDPFIAQSSPESDGWKIVVRPAPNAPPAVATPGAFEPLSFFARLFSADAAQVDTVLGDVQPGSPAAAYVDFQRRFLAIAGAAGAVIDRSYVYLTTAGVRVCVTPQECVEVTDLALAGGQLGSFAVDGHDIAPRLGRSGEPVGVGTAAVRLVGAYDSVTGEDLAVQLELTGTGAEVFELSTAVYVAPDGAQAAVDVSRSIGAGDGQLTGTITVQLTFPDAAPGGEVRFLVHGTGAAAPLAAVVPVEPFAPAT